MKESIKKRVESLEKTVGHTIVLIVVDNVKEPGFATVDGKKMSLAEMEELLKTLPKNVKVFKVEVVDNEPFKGKITENE
jgi:hypothetical protein